MMSDKQYPMILQTREDYDFIMANFPKEKWEPDVNKLLFDAFEEIIVGVVNISDNYTEDMKLFKKDYVHNYKKIIRKFFRIVEDIHSDYEKIIEFKDRSELRKYTDFDKYYFHIKTRVNPNSKAIRIGFTTDELFAIVFGFLDPTLKGKINEFEKLSNKYEEMLQNVEDDDANNGGNDSGTENK